MPKTKLTAVSAAAVVVAALATAPVAQARVYDIPKTLGRTLDRVAARTPVPVRVPGSLPLDYDKRVYASGSGGRRSWTISLAATRDCGGANVCFLGFFSGERGARPAFRRTVHLARGITGYYKPLSCGASCSPPEIQWIQGGVLFTIQAKVAGGLPRALVDAANEAIIAKPR